MKYSFASYCFHRLLESGQQDMFGYIEDSRKMGAAQLDPWNAHLDVVLKEDNALKASASLDDTFSAATLAYVDRVKAAADSAGLPFGCVAADGSHLYEATPEARQINRASAYRWIDVAQRLGARQVRIDTGGTAELPDEMFDIVVAGYHDLIPRVQDKGMELLFENHWGASNVPENVVKVLKAADGLGLLFDTNNWAAGTQQKGWEMCAPYARSVHIKTFTFDATGSDPTVDLPRVIKLLVDGGYDDVWGIESVPKNGDEYGAVQKTAALIERILKAL